MHSTVPTSRPVAGGALDPRFMPESEIPARPAASAWLSPSRSTIDTAARCSSGSPASKGPQHAESFADDAGVILLEECSGLVLQRRCQLLAVARGSAILVDDRVTPMRKTQFGNRSLSLSVPTFEMDARECQRRGRQHDAGSRFVDARKVCSCGNISRHTSAQWAATSLQGCPQSFRRSSLLSLSASTWVPRQY